MIVLQDFIRDKPEAVFIWRTSISTMEEYTSDRLRAAGATVAEGLFRRDDDDAEADQSFVIKPNICGGPREGEDPEAYTPQPGESTNVDVVRGVIETLKSLGTPGNRITMTEGRSTLHLGRVFHGNGYTSMAAETGAFLLNNGRDPYQPHELNWVELEHGVVTHKLPIVRPVGDCGTQLINIATMKAHGLVIATLTCKNLQGLVAFGYKHFCNNLEDVEAGSGHYTAEVRSHFRPHLRQILEPGFQRHHADDPDWGMRDELYANRACDSLLAIRPMINIVEGILARSGTGYRRGEDVLANAIVAGINPVHVDAVATFMMGHDPGKPNYLRMARERGLGTNDPREIETYLWTQDGPVLCEALEDMDRLSVGVFRRGDDSEAVLI